MNRVVMVVNNPATSDYRVVKSAEALAAEGYDCHVLGILRPGFEARETLNGVTYHRVRLKVGLLSLLIGYFPEIVRYLEKPPQELAKGPEEGKSPTALLIAVVVRGGRAVNSVITKTVLSALVVLVITMAMVGFFILYAAAVPYLALRFVIVSMRTIAESIERILRGELSLARTVTGSATHLFKIGSSEIRKDSQRLRQYAKSGQRLLKRILNRILSVRRQVGMTVVVRGNASVSKLRTGVRNLVNQRLNKLRPQISPIGVRYLQGRYLNSWYEPLLNLRADVYHAHELWSLQACAIVAETLHARLVYDSHELEAHRNNDWCNASNRARIKYERQYIRRADAVISVSPGCVEEIRKSYGLEKVHLLRNTPLLGALTPSGTHLRTWIGLDDDAPLIVYTGSVTINRGLELVLQALQELPQFHLVTVGPWNQDVQDRLLEMAKTLGVTDRFHSHPKVPPEELIDLISTADLAIIPIQNACLSYYHCLPNKLFEAAFAGLPIVASNLPDMSDFILGNELGCVFDSEDVSALAEAVATIYTRRHYYRSKQKVAALRKAHCFERERRVLTGIYSVLATKASSATVDAAAFYQDTQRVNQS